MSLAPHTSKIFDKVCTLECIKPYCLVGGTALAHQLENRLSEDVDLMSWINNKKEKPEVDWVKIEKELSKIGDITSREIWDFDHVEFVVSGVKISFYASSKFSPVDNLIPYKDNMFLADVLSIAAMKIELMMRRSNFRDYYDVYSILKNGYDFKEIVQKATAYSEHKLSTKNLLAMLIDSDRFKMDATFALLKTQYQVGAKDIGEFIKIQIKNAYTSS